MRIQFTLKVYVYSKDYKKDFKLYGAFLWTEFTCLKVMRHCWTVDYFNCYLNKMPKPASHSSHVLRIEEVREY